MALTCCVNGVMVAATLRFSAAVPRLAPCIPGGGRVRVKGEGRSARVHRLFVSGEGERGARNFIDAWMGQGRGVV